MELTYPAILAVCNLGVLALDYGNSYACDISTKPTLLAESVLLLLVALFKAFKLYMFKERPNIPAFLTADFWPVSGPLLLANSACAIYCLAVYFQSEVQNCWNTTLIGTVTLFNLILYAMPCVFMLTIVVFYGVFILLSCLPCIRRLDEPEPPNVFDYTRVFKKRHFEAVKYCITDLTCAICVSEFDVEDRVVQLSCQHWFHWDCNREWLRVKLECPLCRCKITADSESKSCSP